MSNFDEVVFGKKTFSDILKEIYDRSSTKEKQINDLILQLQDLIQNIADATMMVPLIAKYMELNIKNDDALIKMAAIVQNAINRGKNTGDDSITDSEREQLLELAQQAVADKSIQSNKGIANS
jgi:hypothetical protein